MDTSEVSAHFTSSVQKHFRPELVNRIDQIIAFEPLSQKTVRFIVEREISQLKKREGIKFRKLELNIQPEVFDYLAQKGYHRLYGARQLQRTIREELISPLARQLNEQDFDDQLIIQAFLSENQLQLSIEADPLGLDLLLEELEKINQADYASELRRTVIRLQEGHGYVRLLSELDIMEHQKKNRKQEFWQNRALAKKYAAHLAIKQRLKETLDTIEDYEKELSLSCMGLIPYQPAITQKIKDWEEHFLTFKKDLLALMFPQFNYCYFDIYGKPVFLSWNSIYNFLSIRNSKSVQKQYGFANLIIRKCWI